MSSSSTSSFSALDGLIGDMQTLEKPSKSKIIKLTKSYLELFTKQDMVPFHHSIFKHFFEKKSQSCLQKNDRKIAVLFLIDSILKNINLTVSPHATNAIQMTFREMRQYLFTMFMDVIQLGQQPKLATLFETWNSASWRPYVFSDSQWKTLLSPPLPPPPSPPPQPMVMSLPMLPPLPHYPMTMMQYPLHPAVYYYYPAPPPPPPQQLPPPPPPTTTTKSASDELAAFIKEYLRIFPSFILSSA
jgi:hypothetical protein